MIDIIIYMKMNTVYYLLLGGEKMEKVRAFFIGSVLYCVFINPETNNSIIRRIYNADFEKRTGFIKWNSNKVKVDFYF